MKWPCSDFGRIYHITEITNGVRRGWPPKIATNMPIVLTTVHDDRLYNEDGNEQDAMQSELEREDGMMLARGTSNKSAVISTTCHTPLGVNILRTEFFRCY
jgi:hypothetical protein